tara:strand:+ start:521 stop:718 length:198 start_codon:yes stop_codon:yes gene_type:complete
MIRIIKNPNFPQWFKIEFIDKLGFFDIFDEVKGKGKALRIAKQLAEEQKVGHIDVDGFIAETEDL